MKINSKIIIIVTIFVSVLVSGGIIYWFQKDKSENQTNTLNNPTPQISQTHSACLADDEWPTIYPSYWSMGSSFKQGGTINVYLIKKKEINFDSVSGEELGKQLKNKNRFNFSINNVRSSAYIPDTLKCGIYIVKAFKNGYKNELWHYDYSGKGRNILILNEYDENGDNIRGIDSYDSYAKVDTTETYVAIIRSWVGDENHALVIKNLKTMEDVYVVTLKELVEKYGIEPGTIQLSGWYKNIFQFEIIFPSERNPWFRLYSDTWKLEKTETLDEILELPI